MKRFEFNITVGYLNPKSNKYVCTNFLIFQDCYSDALLYANMMLDVMKAHEMLPTAHTDDAILHVQRRGLSHDPNTLVLLGDPVQGMFDVYAEKFKLFWHSKPDGFLLEDSVAW